MFCSGSKTSSIALAGSPLFVEAILSISSSKTTGLETSAFKIPLIILPGIAPTYVLLCPRISLSSWTPPSEILINFLFKASATVFDKDVFPVPGGPTKQMIGTLLKVSLLWIPSLNKLRSTSFSLSSSSFFQYFLHLIFD
nr:hypothetical protein [Mycoplasmopsis cynos]